MAILREIVAVWLGRYGRGRPWRGGGKSWGSSRTLWWTAAWICFGWACSGGRGSSARCLAPSSVICRSAGWRRKSFARRGSPSAGTLRFAAPGASEAWLIRARLGETRAFSWVSGQSSAWLPRASSTPFILLLVNRDSQHSNLHFRWWSHWILGVFRPGARGRCWLAVYFCLAPASTSFRFPSPNLWRGLDRSWNGQDFAETNSFMQYLFWKNRPEVATAIKMTPRSYQPFLLAHSIFWGYLHSWYILSRQKVCGPGSKHPAHCSGAQKTLY